MPTPEELKAYLAVMKEAGCTRFQSGDLRIEMSPPAPKPPPSTIDEVLSALPGGRKMTEDDWLFAASEGLPTGPDPKKDEELDS